MPSIPYNDLGKLSTGDDRDITLENFVLNYFEISPKEFSDLKFFDELTLDTFTTNLMGNPTPNQCTGMISWISAEPGGAPVTDGLLGGNVNVSNTGMLDLNWALSLDPSNVITTNVAGNVIYDVDYILEYPGVGANTSPLYYLNVAYTNEDCFANGNCNVSDPVENVYTGDCTGITTTWKGIQTKGGKHCAGYQGEINTQAPVVLVGTDFWSSIQNIYYPFGNVSADFAMEGNTTYSFEFDISAIPPGSIAEGSVYCKNKFKTSTPTMWIANAPNGAPLITTNGCEAKKIINSAGDRLTIKYGGNETNRDVDLTAISGVSFFINLQLGPGTTTNFVDSLEVDLRIVTEDDANINYDAPLVSQRTVTPIGFASGVNTVFDFPESGEYLVSAHITDETGATYQQTKTVVIDKDSAVNNGLRVPPRDPNYSPGETITRGFLGYGPQFSCTPGKYLNNPRYVLIGSEFGYNGKNYNMTPNMAGCLAFNCLDNCLGTNLTGSGPNGLMIRSTIDNCEPDFYGTSETSGTVLNWNLPSSTDVFASIESDILYYPLVIPTKELSSTSTVHGSLEVPGSNILMWISTEPGGGPNNCYGFLDSYDNYYSMNGLMKFYASYSNGVVEEFKKSHAQLEMGHTYYLNIARVSGNVQKFRNGEELTFRANKDITVMWSGMKSWNYQPSYTAFKPSQGIQTSPIIDGTDFSNVSIASEVEPVSYGVDENYGICAETWDSGQTDTVPVKVLPGSRVAMPFTTTTRMYKGEMLITTRDKPWNRPSDIKMYVVDAPEKPLSAAYGKILTATENNDGGVNINFNMEIEVEGYNGSLGSDVVLNKFTTYYMIVENDSTETFTAFRDLTMVHDAAYGLPNTNYSLYPPWCINTQKVNVGGSPSYTTEGMNREKPVLLGAELDCAFRDNQTFNYYKLGQRFTIKGIDVICNNIISSCLAENPDPTVQDVLMCAGINHDSLNPDTPWPNPNYPGQVAKNNDNRLNTQSPDPEQLTFTTGSGLNLYGSYVPSTMPLSGGASSVDQIVREAIDNQDLSVFNSNGIKVTANNGTPIAAVARESNADNWQSYLDRFEKFGNYASFASYPLTGDADLMPNSFRIRKRKVKNPNVYGFEVPLKDGRFVNATSQRVTGGTIKSLAKPLKIIPRTPRAIKTFNVNDEAYSKVIPSNINQTYRNTYYNPRSIGAYFNTKGRQIQNIADAGFIADPNTFNVPGGAFVASSGSNESIPGNFPRITNDTIPTLGGEDFFLPDAQQPVAGDINFAKAPEMSMQPLKVDEFGNYVPAGPPAIIDLRQATPTAKITGLEAAAVTDGSELYINDRKIVFKYGGSLSSIKSQINCGKLGVKAISGRDEAGNEILTISSCDSSPWTVANGCGGGTFQQVGDFHINRGFDQSKSVTSVFVPRDQLVGGNVTPSGNASVINIPYTDQNFTNTGRLVDVNFDRLLYVDPTFPSGVPNPGDFKNYTEFAVPNDSGIMLPQETVSVSTSGKGYKVGDRLRLVGGTPVNTNKGPVTIICIETAGSGYVNPANLTVQIGDGTTPGFGAVARVSSLDMNGGIAGIEMLNYGVGYDPARPPKVSIIDNFSAQAYQNLKIVNGLNQFDPVNLSKGDVFRFDYPEITDSTDQNVAESYIQVTQTYYRVSDKVGDVVFVPGGTDETNNCRMYYGGRTVDGNYPSINISTGEVFGNVTHTRYKAVIGMDSSESVSRGQYIRISSTGTGANAAVVNSLPELLVSDHMIGKDGAGNDVIALNMPIVRHRALLNASTIDAIAAEMEQDTVTVSYAKRFLPNTDVGNFIPIAPNGIPAVDAELSALIGVDPAKIQEDENGNPTGINPADPFIGGYAALGGPLRVAKFLVSAVDADGGIAGLKLLDRGLYRVFPSDLTFGIPLEYDSELLGTPSAAAQAYQRSQNIGIRSADSLGGVDPINNNILYGFTHPEYYYSEGGTPKARKEFEIATLVNEGTLRDPSGGAAVGTGAKHSQWIRTNEYKVVQVNGQVDYVSYWGTPGAYDPTTLVEVIKKNDDGSTQTSLEPKSLEFTLNSSGEPIAVKEPLTIAGGQGARVFLTAQDVPDCSEEGTARQDLGLPDVVREIDGPRTFVNAANTGLIDVGYQPPDISWEVDGDGDIANVTLNTIYPGVRFNGLDWFGIPSDDYAVGALCIQATLSSPNLTVSQTQDELERIYQSSDVFGVSQETFTLPESNLTIPVNTNNGVLNAAILSLLCIDSIQTDPNSVFGDGPVFATIQELYKYDISNIYGQEVRLNNSKQDVDAFVFKSKRFKDLDQVDLFGYLKDINTKIPTYVDIPEKLWVDSVTLDDSLANLAVRFPGFTQGGWGYFENNFMNRYQTPLVDTRYVHNSIIYDPISGARTTDLYPWDPFKGVLPGFIDKEIDYISEEDPVVYNKQRHQFGTKQIGAVWWDTSSIRYQWYEQGTNQDRWRNWGKAFPGSTVIICEWVESRAKPQNWNGDGTPRWQDRYITERRWDPVKQVYTNFYYYWVTNRTTVDARLRKTRNRQYDTRTIARYLSDPVGFGIHMISFLSKNAVMFSNLSDVLRDSGNHVQINLARDLDPDGIKHTAWKLIREDDDNSVIPENITLKLTDSLAGENQVGEVVPDPGLSSVMSYGAKFRPRQSMFMDIKEARRTMVYVLNELFANLKLYTDFPTWDDNFPSSDDWQYIERVNYYSIIYVDENTNEPVRYDDSYKPIFNVATISDLNSLTDLPDGTVVQVAGTELAEPQLWIYNVESNDFSQIAILNDTIRFKDTTFTDETNSQMSLEIRNVLNLFNDDLFQRFNFWNILFFEMLKYAYMEQRQLDWAFKTTYLYVEKEEEDLIQISGFKPDNYQAILDYMDEAKPYTSKVREYRDGKSPPMEIIGTIQPGDGIPGDGIYDDINSGVPGIPGLPGPGEDISNELPEDVNPNAGLRSVSDYDKPPYPDPNTGTIRILDDFNQADRNIMATDPDYVNYFSVNNKADDPIRHNNINLTYDRTNWRFTEYLWNANTTPLEQSISNNIVNLTSQTSKEVAANADVRAIDRIFKFDPVVINQFNLDIENNYRVFSSAYSYPANTYVRRPNDVLSASYDLYKSNKFVSAGTIFKSSDWDLQEAPYTDIITNVDVVYDIVESGNLNFTLALLKNKVGGDWQGETLDANVFTKVVPGADPTYDYQTQFGYGTEDYEQFYWDVVQEVNNYVGIFKPPPEVNLRRNDRDYDGFDGISFLRVLYGEERPEELIQVDPYETFIVNCVTNTQTAVVPIGAADEWINPRTGLTETGQNGNIVIVGGAITEVNVSDDLIDRSYGTCRAVSIEAMDEGGPGANAEFRLNLQSPPDGWPGGASWPQIANIEVVSGGTGYDANTTTVYLTVALNKNANPVQFQIFESLFGQTDYGRVRQRTTLKEDLFTWSEQIVVNEPKLLPDPLPGAPGYLWIDGSEYVEYERKDNTTGIITQFQRGAEGTTIQDWSANVEVWDGSEEQKFNDIDPWRNIWLDQGYRYEQIYNWDDNNYEDNDDPGNIFVMTDEAVSGNLVVESNLDIIISETSGGNANTGWQPGWDYGNIEQQICNVTSVSYLERGRARLELDCQVPRVTGFCKITTDLSSGDIQFMIDESGNADVITLEDPLSNIQIIGEVLSGSGIGNALSNVQLIPAGNDEYDPRATVRSNVFVTGTATGNISITENYTPVLEPNANITGFADITGQDVFEVANTINSFAFSTVSARVDDVWQSGIRRQYLRISGRYFTINEIDTPVLHIDPGTYNAEWFDYNAVTTNTIIIEDDIWISEELVEGMSNTLVTFNIDLNNIPWDYANATGFPALSLADLANTDSKDNNSIMKFLHGVDTPASEL